MECALVIGEEADGSDVIGRILKMLGDLNQSPVGTVIYDQLTQLGREHQALRAKIDQTYSTLLHLLLDAYSRSPTPEAVTRLHAQLIQLRNGNATAADTPMQALASAAVPPPAPTPAPQPTSVSPPPAPETPVEAPVEPAAENDAPNGAAQTERRVNTAYRLHLDRKRDEIEKLQETLSQSIREAVSQNREFGAMLQIELGALKQANGAHRPAAT